MTLKAFFTYYGGKHRSIARYPEPMLEHVVEPFAGSAGYATRYYDRKVTLADKSPVVAGTWKYLVRAPASEILSIPDLEPGQSVDDLNVLQEQRWLIGWWLNKGAASPCKTPSAWMRAGTHSTSYWGANIKHRIASQVDHIRHWEVLCCDYHDIPDYRATWFIDPPYRDAGRHYPYGSADIDFKDLARWSFSRQGEIMVCENTGADWLPFEHFADLKANSSKTGGKVSSESLCHVLLS